MQALQGTAREPVLRSLLAYINLGGEGSEVELAAVKRQIERSGEHYESLTLRVKGVVKVRLSGPVSSAFNPGKLSETILFHGTPMGNIGSILGAGFKPPAQASAHGRGIYFSKSAKTAVWFCRPDAGPAPDRQNVLLLVCRVATGRVLTMGQPDSSMTGEALALRGFDSVHVPAGRIPSWILEEEQVVVYTALQAAPATPTVA
jgi:hypothetical protein